MPEGFAFPVSHNLWAPLRLGPVAARPREGPSLEVFGRLAPGVSLEEARAELSAIGARMRADLPDTHRNLHPQMLGYVEEIFGGLSGLELIGALSLNIPVLLFLALVCANVALLMFARAATRENEIAVRSALGASRARIISQLFVEALVLGSGATVVGLLAARFGLRWLMNRIETDILEGPLPFWFHASLSPTTVLYACLLTLLVAVITGVFPGFKVTRGVATRLRQAGAGGGGLRFGGVWTAVIVAQIAITVAAPVFTFAAEAERKQVTGVRLGFDESRYISARLEMDRDPPAGTPFDTTRAAFLARYEAAFIELEERLRADASVAGVTYAERLPRHYHPHRIIELDAGGAAPIRDEWPLGYRVSSVSVGPGYFATFDAPVTVGRDFHSGDFVAGALPVIVNESFVRNVLGGHNPIGRRLRYVEKEEWDAPLPEAERGPWYEIVGVVPDLGLAPEGFDPKFAGFYHPAAPRSIYPRQVAVRVRGDAGAFVRSLRSIATATDPTLRLYYPMPFTELDRADEDFVLFWLRLLVAATATVLMLSLAGIYAVMAFTVSQRTREIGIRVALGASRRDVILAVFRRPLIQVSLGVLTGMVLLTGLMSAAEGELLSVRKVVILFVYSVAMLGICLLASIVPTRRALAVEPTEALRAE
jgi:predicted permease